MESSLSSKSSTLFSVVLLELNAELLELEGAQAIASSSSSFELQGLEGALGRAPGARWRMTPSSWSSNLMHAIEKLTVASKLRNCFDIRDLVSAYVALIKINANQDQYILNHFITASATFNHMDYAMSAFSQIESPNVFVYNAIIGGFVRCNEPIQALEFYRLMLRAQVLPTNYTFSSLIKGCGSACQPIIGDSVHAHVCKSAFESHLFVQTALIVFYSRIGRIRQATQVFDEMLVRDAFTWTTMLSGLSRIGDMVSAWRLFTSMPEKIIPAWNTLIDGYAKVRNVEAAALLFDQMPATARDVISWTTMISCYSQNKRYREAVNLFNEMKINGLIPDEVTMATVVSACAHLGALDLGKGLHNYIIQNGFNLDVYLGSALIDMYAKCGKLDMSLVVFFKLREKNLYCWNSVIECLAIHGYAKEALVVLQKMEREKIKPNGITFVSLLSACAHAGLVEEGRKVFNKMTHIYHIIPAVSHYGCMVDLFGKAGLLREAIKLIRSMGTEPNAAVWGALLSASKLHKNLEMAQIAANELLLLEPGNSGHQMLMVNMYAEANRWSDASNMRVAMKKMGAEKTSPGFSWIEMESEVHCFAASSRSHPASAEIYLLLVELSRQMKITDYALQLFC